MRERRRHRTGILPALCLGAVSCLAGGSARAAGPEGPVVIYLVDTLRADRMSVHGAPRRTTPSAEQLATEASVFENAYSISSWTRASVGTLMTSLLPAEAGVLGRYGVLDPKVPYLPQLFQRRGWKTAAFVANGNVFDSRTGFNRGFESFTSITSKVNPQFLCAIGREVVDPAIEFLQRQTDPRFFLYIHVVDPHADYYSEGRYKQLFPAESTGKKASERETLLLAYDRAIRQADDQFGRIADALRAKGFWNGATVIYTSDHGEEFLERGGRGHGFTLFEEQIRIPLIIKFPKGLQKPGRRGDFVTLAELTPTLAEMFDLERSARWIGTDLRKTVQERLLYWTEDLDSVRLYAFRSGSRKVIVQLYPVFAIHVYDLARDAGETSGQAMDCARSGDQNARALLELAEQRRSRDVTYFSSLKLEKTGIQRLTVDLAANLAAVEKPFVTVADYCAFSPRIRNHALTFKEELGAEASFHLTLSADDKGSFAPFRLDVLDAQGQPFDAAARESIFHVVKTERPTLHGPTSDEVLQNLRNLGYLGGVGH